MIWSNCWGQIIVYDLKLVDSYFKTKPYRDLHLYDDGSESDFPHDWNIDNGAIQLVLSRVSVDVYPSHTPLWKRTDWGEP